MPTKSQIAKISETLREARSRLKTWQAVSDELYGGEINGAVLSRIANEHDPYYPKEKSIRDLLIPPPRDYEPAKHTIVVFGPKTEVDRYRKAVKVKDRLKLLLKATEKHIAPCAGCGKYVYSEIEIVEFAEYLFCASCGEGK